MNSTDCLVLGAEGPVSRFPFDSSAEVSFLQLQVRGRSRSKCAAELEC